MSDDILLKSVSNKRWVKKIINESISYKELNNWNNSLKIIFLFLKNYFGTKYTYQTFYKYNDGILKLYSIDTGSPLHIIFDSNILSENEAMLNFINNKRTELETFNNNTNSDSPKIKKAIKIPNDTFTLSKNSINVNNSNFYFYGKYFKEVIINLRSGLVDTETGLVYYITKDRYIAPTTIYNYLLHNDFNCKGRVSNKFELFLDIIAPVLIKYYNLRNTTPMDVLEAFKLKFNDLYSIFFNYDETFNNNEDENNSEITNTESSIKQLEVQTDANLDKKYEYESNINGKKTKNQHQKSLQKYTVEIDNSPTEKDDVTMHILSKKGISGVLPFLYTSEVITDERARTYVDVCNMVISNVEKIEDNLYSSNFGKILKYNKKNLGEIIDNSPESGDFTDDREKLGAKKLKIATASTQDRTKLRKISVRVCDCYLDSMKKAKEKNFVDDYENSEGLNYNLHLYLVEILSALAVCACPKNCIWQEKIPDSGLEKFKEHVGVSKDTPDFTTNCYISFPEASNFPLADSVIYINGIRTYLSTKGGAKAEGANPSIKTLSEFVYGEDGKTLTYLTESVMKTYPNEFNVFLELLKGSVSSLNFNKINSYIGCSDRYELEDWLKSNKKIMTEIVLKILQAQSFQFMQAKCKATSDEKDFHFDYSIQYPAVFNGDIDILFVKNSIKFHIANQEL